MAGWEAGFPVPQAGQDKAWLKQEAEDQDFAGMVHELETRKDLQDILADGVDVWGRSRQSPPAMRYEEGFLAILGTGGANAEIEADHGSVCRGLCQFV